MREKLIEFLDKAHKKPLGKEYRERLWNIADHLIANGVTVQQWIPVSERLPDNSATVNLCTRSKIVGTGFYNKYTKSWAQYYSGGAICVDVTHWQPMPQPPKGE